MVNGMWLFNHRGRQLTGVSSGKKVKIPLDSQ